MPRREGCELTAHWVATSRSTSHISTQVTLSQRECAFVIFFPPKKTYKIKVSSVHCSNAEFPWADLRASSLFQKGPIYLCACQSPRGQEANTPSRRPFQ